MRNEIINNLDNPKQLEKLYRENSKIFKIEFNNIYHDIKDNITAQIWNARLNFEYDEISWGSRRELIFVIIASVIAGLLSELPKIFSIDPEYFYPRNISFIIFPFLISYFAWK